MCTRQNSKRKKAKIEQKKLDLETCLCVNGLFFLRHFMFWFRCHSHSDTNYTNWSQKRKESIVFDAQQQEFNVYVLHKYGHCNQMAMCGRARRCSDNCFGDNFLLPLLLHANPRRQPNFRDTSYCVRAHRFSFCSVLIDRRALFQGTNLGIPNFFKLQSKWRLHVNCKLHSQTPMYYYYYYYWTATNTKFEEKRE